MLNNRVLSSCVKSLINEFFHKSSWKSLLHKPNYQLPVSLYKLMPEAENDVLEVLSEHLVDLQEHFSEEEIIKLKSEFPAVVYYCLCYTENGYYHQNMHGVIPNSVCELLMQIACADRTKSFFFPYSSIGQFPAAISCENFYAFEVNTKFNALSKIMFYKQKEANNFELRDKLSENFENTKFDYIFSFPPILQGMPKREIAIAFYKYIRENLKENGELYLLVPLEFCNSSQWFAIRKGIWETRSSVSVIALPDGAMGEYTNVKFCLVCIVKNNSDSVNLVNTSGKEFMALEDVAGSKIGTLKTKSIIDTIETIDERYFWRGKHENLKHAFNLLPSRYLVQQNLLSELNINSLCPLRNLVEVLNLRPINKNDESMPTVGVKELSDNYINCTVVPNPNDEYQLGSKRLVLEEDCFLAAFVRGKFKVGKVFGVSKNTPVALKTPVFAFKIYEGVDIYGDYLLRCLTSELVAKQALYLQGSGIDMSRQRFTTEDFYDIQIEIDLIDNQRIICQQDAKSLLTEKTDLEKAYEEYRMDIHMKKHSMGQTIFNLNTWWEILTNARLETGGILDESTFIGRFEPVAISEIFQYLEYSIEKLTTQINKLDRGYGFTVENIALPDFIKNYINKNRTPHYNIFFVDEKLHYFHFEKKNKNSEDCNENLENEDVNEYKEGDALENIDFSAEALTIIFDNIVDNANSHGFRSRENVGNNKIKIELSTEGGNHVITISNNGSPLEIISENNVFIYGKTSVSEEDHIKTGSKSKKHYGIGGYEIKRLMEEFGGIAEFCSNPNEEYPISYKLTFYRSK